MQENALNNQLPFLFAKNYGVFVESVTDQAVVIVHRPEISLPTLLELQRFFTRPIKLKETSADEFPHQLAKAYERGKESAMEAIVGMEESANLKELVSQLPTTEDLLETENDAPIIKLLNAILSQAIKQKSSDIHFETFEDKLMVRFRIDGVLQEILQPPRVLASLLVSRIKVMAKLDIAEKRLPQDGRISLRIAGRAVDVRVSTIPTHYGERIVLRLLDKQSAPLDLARLGMSSESLIVMRQLIEKPHGIILVTGPTGSGKTTTLYAALTELNEVSRNILTVEDPIEYYLPGIGQTQVNAKVEMTFSRGLRAILRQDPDIVMVGEIRDLETAEMAVQASLTGHLVLSTLHTNSAIGAVTRLRDMGVEPFLLSSTLIGVAAQRLVRLLCSHCKEKQIAPAGTLRLMGMTAQEGLALCRPTGCKQCNDTGYYGRTGIYEIIAMNDRLRSMIHDNSSEALMEMEARQHFPSMRMDGWRRVLNGDTTVEEVLRVTSEG
ncbi:MAG: type II secretion system protein GspE [Coxiella sp. RIFCSPHIGHO2_12_FULL_42_15]|nr:MAG: type II secretion system protein GspE [Coxiella sp. RIFCSPHIGHO2_12_FULL_42_15]